MKICKKQINKTQMMKMYEHIGNHKHQYKSKNKKIHGNQTNYIKINKTIKCNRFI